MAALWNQRKRAADKKMAREAKKRLKKKAEEELKRQKREEVEAEEHRKVVDRHSEDAHFELMAWKHNNIEHFATVYVYLLKTLFKFRASISRIIGENPAKWIYRFGHTGPQIRNHAATLLHGIGLHHVRVVTWAPSLARFQRQANQRQFCLVLFTHANTVMFLARCLYKFHRPWANVVNKTRLEEDIAAIVKEMDPLVETLLLMDYSVTGFYKRCWREAEAESFLRSLQESGLLGTPETPDIKESNQAEDAKVQSKASENLLDEFTNAFYMLNVSTGDVMACSKWISTSNSGCNCFFVEVWSEDGQRAHLGIQSAYDAFDLTKSSRT